MFVPRDMEKSGEGLAARYAKAQCLVFRRYEDGELASLGEHSEKVKAHLTNALVSSKRMRSLQVDLNDGGKWRSVSSVLRQQSMILQQLRHLHITLYNIESPYTLISECFPFLESLHMYCTPMSDDPLALNKLQVMVIEMADDSESDWEFAWTLPSLTHLAISVDDSFGSEFDATKIGHLGQTLKVLDLTEIGTVITWSWGSFPKLEEYSGEVPEEQFYPIPEGHPLRLLDEQRVTSRKNPNGDGGEED